MRMNRAKWMLRVAAEDWRVDEGGPQLSRRYRELMVQRGRYQGGEHLSWEGQGGALLVVRVGSDLGSRFSGWAANGGSSSEKPHTSTALITQEECSRVMSTDSAKASLRRPPPG